ncbi:MAG: BlaR1 family beta-lactam sensor/signal transducer [Lachnospiraceae bacterium]
MNEFIYFIMSALAATITILFILLVKKVLKKHITTRWQYNLDLLFFVLLAAPFVPSGILNYTGAGNWLSGMYFGGKTTANASAAIDGSVRYADNTGLLQDFAVSVKRSIPEYLPIVFIVIWLVGIIVFALFTIISNRNLRLVKESMKPVEDAELISLITQYKNELGIKRNIRFGTSVLVKTPITVGLFKTRVILPAETLAVEDVRYILMHELVHCKNKDIVINSVMCLFQILYWFHPLVYFVFKEMRLDRERACDVSVLKMLPDDLHIEYGRTLLKFVSKLSYSSALSFASDVGGTKRQIKKRIIGIADFIKESKQLKIKSVCTFIIIGLLVFSQMTAISALASNNDSAYQFASDNIVYEDLSASFDGYEGSFVLYDLEADQYSIHNKAKSTTRISPASTYKIYSALIALETGIIDTDQSIRNWNGTSYPFEAWNQDQDLRSAMQNSVSWYFQDIDAEIGIKTLESYFTQLSYGNHDLSGGITDYWAESSLLISPVEQVELLKDFYQNETIFKTAHVNTLKDVLRISEKDGAVLSGKTGTCAVNGKTINGWFIGYVENKGHVYIFATNIQGEDNTGGSAAAQITLAILDDKDIY